MDSLLSKVKKRPCRNKAWRGYLSVHYLWPHWNPGRKAVPAEICFRPRADNCNIKLRHQDKGVQGRTIKSGQANPLEPTYSSQEKEPRVSSFYCTTRARQLSKIPVHINLFPLTNVLKITTDCLFLLSPNFYGPYHLVNRYRHGVSTTHPSPCSLTHPSFLLFCLLRFLPNNCLSASQAPFPGWRNSSSAHY